jgi:MazG family protein
MRRNKPKKKSFSALIKIMARLRAPGGCPWDREQTHKSLLKYLKEESREVEQTVKRKDFNNLQEELGDVLLQVLFHAQMAAEAGRFSIHDVTDTLARKLVRRHPHVFGPGKKEKLTADDVRKRWKAMKVREKGGLPA